MSGWVVSIIVLVIFLVGLLSTPLVFKAGGSTEERRLEVRITWGWGLLATNIGMNNEKTLFGLRIVGVPFPVFRKKPGVVKAKKNGEKRGRKRERHGFNFLAVSTVLNKKLLIVLVRYLKALIKSLRLRLRLSGVYGADDPALTGLLAGLFAALHTGDFHIDLDADFSGPILDVSGEISGRIIPVVILWFTIRLVLAEPVRTLWWTLLKMKMIKRKPKEDAQYV